VQNWVRSLATAGKRFKIAESRLEKIMDRWQVLRELNGRNGLPVEAIRAARANRDTMVPMFLQCIDDCLTSQGVSSSRSSLFLIFHLLGEWREKAAYRPLARLLRLPEGVIDAILGDAITVTVHRVMAGVFDGDPAPIYEIIRDSNADQFIRSRMCQTLAMLARRGELSRDEVARFLADCATRFEQEDGYVWDGWIDAVTWLGLEDMKPLGQQALARGYIESGLTFEEFEQGLRHAVEHPELDPLYPAGDLSLFGDTIAELAGWDCFRPRSQTRNGWRPSLPSLYDPASNPFQKVGRNDPCPCGSGKKFKKCCLTADLGIVLQNGTG
jgi:hypothetical protein